MSEPEPLCKNSANPQSLDARGENGPALETQSNSSLNSYTPFICNIEEDEAVKELKDILYSIENELKEKSTYSGPLSQVAGQFDQRSDEVELLVATEYQKPDNCKEICLLSLPCLGAMPQCIPAWNTRYNVQTLMYQRTKYE